MFGLDFVLKESGCLRNHVFCVHLVVLSALFKSASTILSQLVVSGGGFSRFQPSSIKLMQLLHKPTHITVGCI
jgi:hypothetical protein